MNTLLLVCIVVTSLAVVVQACVLIAMYVMSRRVTRNVDSLISESRRLISPLSNVAQNLRSAGMDLADVMKTTGEQVHHVDQLVDDTRSALSHITDDVR